MSTVILSCTSLLEYVKKAQEVCGTSYPVIKLDRKYHVEPSEMRDHILDTLSKLPEDADTILVAMGFCGGSWQDVTVQKKLVIPRTADCFAMTMTTPEKYAPDLKEVGHMYMMGSGDQDFSIRGIYDGFCRQYDPEMAKIIFDMYLEHYYFLDIIDDGFSDCYDPEYVERAQQDADMFNAELGYVEGSNILLEELVSGQWDDKFMVHEPGQTITHGEFFR